VLPALAKISQQRRWVAWIAPPYVPYAPAWPPLCDLSRVLLIHPRAGGDGFAAVERSLRSGTCGAVLAWPTAGKARRCGGCNWRRQRGILGILFRPDRLAQHARRSSCACRLRVATMAWMFICSNSVADGSSPVTLSMDRLLQQQTTDRPLF